MAKSVLGHLTPLDLLKIRDSVAYDPTSPNGLRWRVKRMGRTASGPGKTFWIDQAHYQAPHVVMILNDRWPGDGDRVVTRIDKSGPWGVVENLKWALRTEAFAEGREHNRLDHLRKVFGDDLPELEEGLRLANLCKRGHQWNGRAVSLQCRQGSEWRCLDCVKERQRNRNTSPEAIATRQAWYEANKEKLRREARERMAARRADPALAEADKQKRLTPERAEKRKLYKAKIRQLFKEQGLTTRGTNPSRTPKQALERAIRAAGRSPSVARLVMNEQRRYWRSNPKAKSEHDRQWAQVSWWLEYQISPDMRLYHREKSKRRKAQNRGQTPVQIPVAALRQRFNEFGNCCAYCGDDGDMQIEHLKPISKGGAHDIGNIVPACASCNTSKRSHSMETWYRSQPFFSELRLHQIRRVIRPPEGQQLALALA